MANIVFIRINGQNIFPTYFAQTAIQEILQGYSLVMKSSDGYNTVVQVEDIEEIKG
jgi:hypothetical protein